MFEAASRCWKHGLGYFGTCNRIPSIVLKCFRFLVTRSLEEFVCASAKCGLSRQEHFNHGPILDLDVFERFEDAVFVFCRIGHRYRAVRLSSPSEFVTNPPFQPIRSLWTGEEKRESELTTRLR